MYDITYFDGNEYASVEEMRKGMKPMFEWLKANGAEETKADPHQVMRPGEPLYDGFILRFETLDLARAFSNKWMQDILKTPEITPMVFEAPQPVVPNNPPPPPVIPVMTKPKDE